MKKWTFYAVLMLIPAIMCGCDDKNEEPQPTPEDATLAIDPTNAAINFTASAEDEAYVYTVITNQTTWSAVSDKIWCKVAKNEAQGTFTITARANTSSTSPSPAKVTITAGNATAIIINVTQDPGDGDDPGGETTVDTKFEIEGGANLTFTANLSDETTHDFSAGGAGKGTLKIDENQVSEGLIILSITHPGNPNNIAIGRKVGDNVAIKLKLDANGVSQQREDGGKLKVNVVAELQTLGTPTVVDMECEQECDLYMGGILFEPIGSAAQPFENTFDGKGFKIYNININHGTGDGTNRGLFSSINSKSTVRNVWIESGTIIGGAKTGAIVGNNDGGTISQCTNKASVTGTAGDVGGICGISIGGAIEDCWNGGIITNSLGSHTGGIVGVNVGSDTKTIYVKNCRNTGNVTSDGGDVGGIAGYHNGIPDATNRREQTRVEWCYNTGNISGTASVGGLVGFGNAVTAVSYNRGNVTGTSNVGGIAGFIAATVIFVYTTGQVTGPAESAGIVIGTHETNANTLHAYWVAGIAGNPALSANPEYPDPIGFSLQPFSDSAWPEWDAADWKDIGGWNGGNPIFPKLKWE